MRDSLTFMTSIVFAPSFNGLREICSPPRSTAASSIGRGLRGVGDGTLAVRDCPRPAMVVAHFVRTLSEICFTTAGDSGIYKSTDAGLTWIRSSNGIDEIQGVIVADRSGILYSSGWSSVFKSTNAGDSWVRVNTTGFSAMATDQDGTVYGGTRWGAVFASTDQGGTWHRMEGDCASDVYAFALTGSAEGVQFLAADDGVFRFDAAGMRWGRVGLPNSDIRALVSHPSGKIFAAPDDDVVAFTSDRGGHWHPSPGGGEEVIALLATSGGVLFSAADSLRRSTDGGERWVRLGNGLPAARASALAEAPDGAIIAGFESYTGEEGSSGGGIYRSTDLGESWVYIGFGLGTVSALAVSHHGVIHASVYPMTYRSSDHGTTWSDYPELYAACYNIIALGGDTVLAGTTYGGMMRTTDDGMSWQPVGPLDPIVRSFATDGMGTVLAATGTDDISGWNGTNGVLGSTDFGATWHDVSAGLAGKSVASVTIAPDGFAYIGTIGSGVWVTQDRVTAAATTAVPYPISFSLAQNFPNPFNPSTTIRYALPARSHVTLIVFNTLGQQVATLVEGETDAGYHEVTFDASHLASGVYLYRLTAGSDVETRKLILVR